MPPCVAIHCPPAARGIGAYCRPTSTASAQHFEPPPSLCRPSFSRACKPAGMRARSPSCAASRWKAVRLGQVRRGSTRRQCAPRVQAEEAAERASEWWRKREAETREAERREKQWREKERPVAEADPLEQFVRIDHGRQSRTGMPEVVYGQGKTAQQMAAILTAMADRATQAGDQGRSRRAVMATRVDPEAAQQRGALDRAPCLAFLALSPALHAAMLQHAPAHPVPSQVVPSAMLPAPHLRPTCAPPAPHLHPACAAPHQVCALLPSAIYHPLARVLHLPLPLPPTAGAEASEAGESGAPCGSGSAAADSTGDSGGGREGASGHVMVVTAGTTDLPVAEVR
ncbi:unnamed protein product [Closterium sp. NIES-65]|nr:unnamed protein product [Closterium sp. NIES-65]